MKESANFCDFFSPVNRFESASSTKANRAKSELDALFGGPVTKDESALEDAQVLGPDGASDPASKLNDLFDD